MEIFKQLVKGFARADLEQESHPRRSLENQGPSVCRFVPDLLQFVEIWWSFLIFSAFPALYLPRKGWPSLQRAFHSVNDSSCFTVALQVLYRPRSSCYNSALVLKHKNASVVRGDLVQLSNIELSMSHSRTIGMTAWPTNHKSRWTCVTCNKVWNS